MQVALLGTYWFIGVLLTLISLSATNGFSIPPEPVEGLCLSTPHVMVILANAMFSVILILIVLYLTRNALDIFHQRREFLCVIITVFPLTVLWGVLNRTHIAPKYTEYIVVIAITLVLQTVMLVYPAVVSMQPFSVAALTYWDSRHDLSSTLSQPTDTNPAKLWLWVRVRIGRVIVCCTPCKTETEPESQRRLSARAARRRRTLGPTPTTLLAIVQSPTHLRDLYRYMETMNNVEVLKCYEMGLRLLNTVPAAFRTKHMNGSPLAVELTVVPTHQSQCSDDTASVTTTQDVPHSGFDLHLISIPSASMGTSASRTVLSISSQPSTGFVDVDTNKWVVTSSIVHNWVTTYIARASYTNVNVDGALHDRICETFTRHCGVYADDIDHTVMEMALLIRTNVLRTWMPTTEE